MKEKGKGKVNQMLIEKTEKMTVSSWVVVLLLATISIGSVGILNKLTHIDNTMTSLNKSYGDVLVRLSANEARDTDQDKRITTLEVRSR